jgi:hypothetical protein
MPNPDVSALRTTLGQNGRYWYRFKPVMRWDVVRFLSCGGIILLILGVSGVLSLLPLLSRASLFNPPYWINWVHLSVGGLGLAVAILGSKRLQLTLALIPAIAGTMVGLGGLVIEAYVAIRNGTPQSSDFSDPLAHLALGMLALWAVRNDRRKHDTGQTSRRTT